MNRRFCLASAVAAAIILTPAVALAQAPTSAALTAHVDSVFSRYTSTTPGCAVGIYQNGAVTFAKGYGLANIEYDAPITPTTPFIVGSVSKQFTAAAIALLVEEKRLSLDDDVRTYIPNSRTTARRSPSTISSITRAACATGGSSSAWQACATTTPTRCRTCST